MLEELIQKSKIPLKRQAEKPETIESYEAGKAARRAAWAGDNRPGQKRGVGSVDVARGTQGTISGAASRAKLTVLNEDGTDGESSIIEAPTPQALKIKVDGVGAKAKGAGKQVRVELISSADPISAPITQLTQAEARALLVAWIQQHPELANYNVPYNGTVLDRIMAAFRLPISFAGFDKAFAYAREHNHLESIASTKRGEVKRAPVPFNPQTASPIAPIKPKHTAVHAVLSEETEARQKPFEELQRQIQAGFKSDPRRFTTAAGKDYKG